MVLCCLYANFSEIISVKRCFYGRISYRKEIFAFSLLVLIEVISQLLFDLNFETLALVISCTI